MDDKTLHTLEYFKILEKLADRTAFAASREKAMALRPTSNIHEARLWQDETSEAVEFLVTRPDMTIGGVRDIRASVDLARRHGVLQPSDLLDVKNTLIAARTLRRSFEPHSERFPSLWGWAMQLPTPLGLVDAINRAISERGEVQDSASEKLAQIRRNLRVAYERLMSKLQHMISDSKNTPLLQDAIITQRDGRYVIPLRAEFKGRIKSIVHDQSSSGATLFVEPIGVVNLNNEYRELQLAERNEERRILAELSAQVGENAETLLHMIRVIAELDFILARAKYADDLKATVPELKGLGRPRDLGKKSKKAKQQNVDGDGEDSQNEKEISLGVIRHPGTIISLTEARHPLLDPQTVVPIDVDLDKHTFVLVVTGPNTGGKTVALKTVGLMVLMAQSGMHIPTHSGSVLTVFRDVYADIGDEQSIEQSLSTFSGHVKNINRILQQADRQSLVILDELGAGTDPQEGAALARSLLSFLLRSSITTLVTTHHPELKAFAHTVPGAVNASVEFDLKTLQPTYHLMIGLPGRSNALAIAKRLGLPKDIIEEARQELDPDELRAESMLDEIHHQRDAARKARGSADRARHQAEKLQNELNERLENIEEERYEILQEARKEAEEQIAELQNEIAELRRELRKAHQPLDSLEAVKVIENQAKTLEEKADQVIVAAPPTKRKRKGSVQVQSPSLAVGRKVFVRSLKTKGTITALDEDEAEVQVGMLRVRARLSDLTGTADEDESTDLSTGKPISRPTTSLPSAVSPGVELDLRGQTGDEAIVSLDRYLESAYLAGLPWVRIIHGKGTGKLRQLIRQELQGHPHVKSFETGGEKEGGEGVTIVKLHAG